MSGMSSAWMPLPLSSTWMRTSPPVPPASVNYPPDVNPETPAAVFDRAHAAVNRPWVSQATKDALIAWAGTTAALPVTHTAAQRRQRFYALQAMILGGPDGQVM